MAIQMRRGNLADYDPDKMLPGEIGVATDEDELYISFGSGNSKRVLTESDIQEVDSSLDAYSENPVQNKVIKSALDAKAPKASPAFTGSPTAPNPAITTNSTRLATTKFVHDVANTKTRIWYGTTNSNVSDAVKVVTVDDSDFSLTTGTLLLVDFKNANSATSISLNVNDLGNKHVSGSFAARIAQYSKILFWYSGTAWYAVEHLPIASYAPRSYSSRIVTTSNRFYGAVLDSNGFLSVCVPWEDTHGSLTATDQGDGVVQLSVT